MKRQRRQASWRRVAAMAAGTCALILACAIGQATAAAPNALAKEELVPILGVTMGPDPRGTVVYVQVFFERRADESGLAVFFRRAPGRFSPMAQTSIKQAIRRAADSMGVSCNSWTVVLTVPYRELTIYGESLSAMVSLSVMAIANGDSIGEDRVLTGTVTPDGHIGTVGAVPEKIMAAKAAQIRRVLIPEELDPADGDWHTPFLMQVSPVRTVDQAYEALTDQSTLVAVH